ncbi:MAG TPA: ABC transporter ATP-binding protein [Steroidobacteraceae bacterium]|nr:ABC transporter ATP-binding protein [Steroidobacteraceae bacterium]
MTEAGPALLEVRGLSVSYRGPRGPVHAVRELDLDLEEHGCLGIVGESGSGKTQLLLALLGLCGPAALLSGSVRYRGEELLGATPARLAALRGRRIAMVFQEPQSALNPYLSIAQQLSEGARHHLKLSRRAALSRAAELLELVQISAPLARLRQYPHELSGGMRQRVTIAMALMCEPEILLLDEPTTALDVTIQAQVLEVLSSIRGSTGVAAIFVSHDFGALAAMAERLTVMYAGRAVEAGAIEQLYTAPLHPYTSGLLRSLPRLDLPLPERLAAIPGQPPDLAELPPGCAFAPRCPLVHSACQARPALLRRQPDQQVACHCALPAPRIAEAWS